jgi:hypothetical protein
MILYNVFYLLVVLVFEQRVGARLQALSHALSHFFFSYFSDRISVFFAQAGLGSRYSNQCFPSSLDYRVQHHAQLLYNIFK